MRVNQKMIVCLSDSLVQGAWGLGIFIAAQWIDVVAIADPDAKRLSAANSSLSGGKASEHADYRAILDRRISMFFILPRQIIGTQNH